MKPRDIGIIQSVLEIIKEPIKVTDIYDKAKELFEKGEIESMFDHGGNTPDRSVSASMLYSLKQRRRVAFFENARKTRFNRFKKRG
ncbi:hypothetical protein KYTH28_14540 [Helicobacter pylori]